MSEGLTRRRSALAIIGRDDVPIAQSFAARAPLGPFERMVVAHIDGKSTIAELASALSISTLELATACDRLRDLGLVEFTTAPTEDVDEGWEPAGS